MNDKDLYQAKLTVFFSGEITASCHMCESPVVAVVRVKYGRRYVACLEHLKNVTLVGLGDLLELSTNQ